MSRGLAAATAWIVCGATGVLLAALPRLLQPKPRADGPWSAPLPERLAAPFPRQWVDASGERVVIPAPPQRIVSGTNFSDCVLLATCPPARIRALHVLSCDPRYSPIAAAAAAFPRHVAPEAEAMLACEPDLVFLASFSRAHTRGLLASSGCTVVRLDRFDTVADIQDNMRAVGWVLGLDREVEEVIATMQAELDALHEGAARRRGWRLLHFAGEWTSGTGTTFDSLLHWVGARNVAAEAELRGSAAITSEQVLALDPDALVLGIDPGGAAVARARLQQDPALRHARAVQHDRLVLVDGAHLLSTSQHVAGAARRIAEQLDAWGRP